MKIFEFCNISHMQILPPVIYNIDTKCSPEARIEKYPCGIDSVQFKHSNQDHDIYPKHININDELKELDETTLRKIQYSNQYDPQIIFTCNKDSRYVVIEREVPVLFNGDIKDFTGKSGDVLIEALGRRVALNLRTRIDYTDRAASLFTFPKKSVDFTTNNIITRSVYESVFKDKKG